MTPDGFAQATFQAWESNDLYYPHWPGVHPASRARWVNCTCLQLMVPDLVVGHGSGADCIQRTSACTGPDVQKSDSETRRQCQPYGRETEFRYVPLRRK